MRRLFFITILLLLLSACGNKSNTFMPERLLTEEEMIDVMTDVQIIEAEINYQKSSDKEQDTISADYKAMTQSYYSQFYEHYGITDSIFVQNMRYYTERPETLKRIMDSVVQRLTREQSESQRDDSQ
jgi:hypothetical protein